MIPRIGDLLTYLVRNGQGVIIDLLRKNGVNSCPTKYWTVILSLLGVIRCPAVCMSVSCRRNG